MWRLALKGIFRQRLRAALIVGGLAIPVAMLVILSSFGAAYEHSLRSELDRMGVQLMVVPLGCPYDAAARVVKGRSLDDTLPASALDSVRADPAVALAAPMLITAVPRPEEKRVDMWVGLDESIRTVKPWWKARSGADWFTATNGVILGSEAAVIEMRATGDKFYCPEANRALRVDGILEQSGTSDDSLFFLPLKSAQEMFGQQGRLTAIAVRLRAPEMLLEAENRLRQIPGAQVATFTEMIGVFLNMVGSVRILLQSITLLAISICLLGIFNTMLAAVLERSSELAVMRAVGASRSQVFALVSSESAMFALFAVFAGWILAAASGGPLENLVRPLLPLVPSGRLWHLSGEALLQALVVCVAAGLLAGLYPAWRASLIQPATAVKPDGC
jgi:putative ABC transport system permease protein